MTLSTRKAMCRAFAVLLATGFLPAASLLPTAEAQSGPAAEYQADRIFQDERGERVPTTFYYTAERQRLDYLVGAERVITIVDRPAGHVVILYPRRKTKQTRPYTAPGWDFGLSQPGARLERVGPEKVGDIAAVKYRASGRTEAGQAYEGVAWLTAQRIVVKLDGTVRRGTTTKRFFMTTENLKVGEVNPRVFLVPPDYEEVKAR